MTNAAFLLADRLETWQVEHQHSVQEVRGVNRLDDLNAWREIARAVELVTTIDRTLQGMAEANEQTSFFESTLYRWYQGVFWPSDWASTTGGRLQMCDPGDINLLRALGALIDAGNQIHLTTDDQRALADVLKQAQSLVEGEQHLPIDVRRYLWSLLVRARFVLADYERSGDEAVRQVALELGGALQTQGEKAERQGDPEAARQWKSAALQLMIGFMGGLGSTTGELAMRTVTNLIGR